jgi:hypothetical protein
MDQTEFIVLVDYDNIPMIERSRGLVAVTKRIVESYGDVVSGAKRIRYRFYGGWYEQNNTTRTAQDLIAEIQLHFPRYIDLHINGTLKRQFVKAELAQTLECDRRRPLTHTYRSRGVPTGLQPATTPLIGCSSPSACALTPVAQLLRTHQCPHKSCTTTLDDAVWRADQKMVDTMLVADLLYLANAPESDIGVVSNDSDVWPGIHCAALSGKNVHHVHPMPKRKTPVHYSSLLNSGYHEYAFL